MPHLLPRISIEALEVSTKSGELQSVHSFEANYRASRAQFKYIRNTALTACGEAIGMNSQVRLWVSRRAASAIAGIVVESFFAALTKELVIDGLLAT